MQIIEHSILTSASPKAVWGLWENVASWNIWDHGIEYSQIDGPFKTGARGTLKPKGGPIVKMKLTSIVPLKRFIDESSLMGTKIIVSHHIQDRGEKILVTHSIEMKGFLAPLLGCTLGRKMKKNLPKEMRSMITMAEEMSK